MIKCTIGLIKIIVIKYYVIFFTHANCTSDRLFPRTHPGIAPNAMSDKDHHFTNFMNHPGVSRMLDEYFQQQSLAGLEMYQAHKDEIHKIAAIHLYNNCIPVELYLNPNGSPTDYGIDELKDDLDRNGLAEIDMSNFELEEFPLAGLKFLNDHCGTVGLNLSNTNIDIVKLNDANLNKIQSLHLDKIRLEKFPCVHNFTALTFLKLNDNKITSLSLESYFDEQSGTYRKIPQLKNISLFRNPITTVYLNFTDIFDVDSTKIHLDKVTFNSSRSSMEAQLKNTGIHLIDSSSNERKNQD